MCTFKKQFEEDFFFQKRFSYTGVEKMSEHTERAKLAENAERYEDMAQVRLVPLD